ncbi:hypothetical protein JCM8547_002897 [Rhodosporidiobolus lusitaniae]
MADLVLPFSNSTSTGYTAIPTDGGTSTPGSSGSHDDSAAILPISNTRTHVRRISSTFGTPDITIDVAPDAAEGDGRDYFREKRSGSAYSAADTIDGEDAPLTGLALGGEGGLGYAKAAAQAARKKRVRRILTVGAMVGVGALSWFGGRETATVARTGGTGARSMVNVKKEMQSSLCNPYDQYGVLNVNLNVPSENVWQPIAAPPECQPIDFMSKLYGIQMGYQTNMSELEFMRDRTIVIFGDSVDRDHNEHFCGLTGGYLEMINDTHPLNPPYPPGREIPPEGYASFMTGLREWPNYAQSRPFVCHIDKFNFRILNVFHYGFRPLTDMIQGHPHFYPPALVEDRFDQIIIPLVANLAAKYGTSPVPDILSIAPGFWGILRQSVEDGRLEYEEVQAGKDASQAKAEHDVWRPMSEEKRRWNEQRISEILRHLAKGWRGVRDKGGKRTPLILWRALHFVRETEKIPFTRSTALDQIGRSVVDRLVEEGRAAEEGAKGWKKWGKSVGAKYLGWKEEGEDEALEGGLGRRLKIDEWGSLMLGQSRAFRDEIHPLPLPGSFLYGNMLLHMDVDASAMALQGTLSEEQCSGNAVAAIAREGETAAGALESVTGDTLVSRGVGTGALEAGDVEMAASASSEVDALPSTFTTLRDGTSGPSTSETSIAIDMPDPSPASTPPLSLPSAAQPQRPMTPPRNSSYSTTLPSSASSETTLVGATQQTALTPSGSQANSGQPTSSLPFSSSFQITQTEIAGDDSPDPLRMVPTASAASSAARSTTSKSFRARSASREPSTPLQSSPSRPAERPQSKTPSSSIAGGEDLGPGSGGAKGKSRVEMGRLAEIVPELSGDGAKDDDDDEVMIDSLPPAPSGPIMPFGRSRPPSRDASVLSAVGTGDEEDGAPPGGEVATRTVRRSSAKYELVVEQTNTRRARRSSGSLAIHSFQPTTSSTSSTSNLPAPSASGPAPPPSITAPSSHPLSQSVPPRNETTASVPPSSPLTSINWTSLPPSSARQPLTSPDRPKRNRRTRATNPASSSDEEGGGSSVRNGELDSIPGSSGTVEHHPSPKKKARRPAAKAPTVKKAAKGKGGRKKKESSPAVEPVEEMHDEEDTMEELEAEQNEAGRNRTRTPVKGKKRKGKGTKAAARDEQDDNLAEIPSSALRWARRTSGRQRGAAAAEKSLKEDSTTEGEQSSVSDTEQESSQEEGEEEEDAIQPQETPKKKRGRPPKNDVAAAAKGKKAVAKPRLTLYSLAGQPSSPTKLSQSIRPTSSYASQLLGMDTAVAQTPEQRAQGWNLMGLPTGRPIWAHVRKVKEEDGFWWPAEIYGNHWDVPFRVKLYLDPASTVLSFTPSEADVIAFPAPSSEDVVTFRNPSKLRFDKRTFRDSLSSQAPSEETFLSVLSQAIAKDTQMADDDSDDDLPPSSLQPSGKKPAEEESEGDASDVQIEEKDEPESDDELLKEEDEAAGITFPAIAIGAYKTEWWACQVSGYEPPRSPTKPKNGAKAPSKKTKPKGKFLVDWTDGTEGKLTRDKLLFPKDKKFLKVPLGQTQLSIKPGYIDHLRTYIATDLPPVFQSIISSTYPHTRSLCADFYAGGLKRSNLAKKSLYGELSDDIVNAMEGAVTAWARTGGEGGGRPKGCDEYETLTDSERATFVVDVLLSTTVTLNYIDDGGLWDGAKKELKKRWKKEKKEGEPTEEEVEEEAFRLAKEQLQARSVTKAILAMRESKGLVKNVQKQRDQENAK